MGKSYCPNSIQNIMIDYATIRREYANGALDEDVLATDPVVQFEIWFKQALSASVMEPNAMHLATVGKDGRPSLRVVLLKGVEQNRFVFYTNLKSKKAEQIATNNVCAATFYWAELARQVRIEGEIFPLDDENSGQYFRSRPRDAQVSAWASQQSKVVKTRTELEQHVKQIQSEYEKYPVLPKPPFWGGYVIDPVAIEFWQGRQNRLHDRIQYTRINGSWAIDRLAP